MSGSLCFNFDFIPAYFTKQISHHIDILTGFAGKQKNDDLIFPIHSFMFPK